MRQRPKRIRSLSGFSLLELLVVVAILMLVMLVFGTFVGTMMMGPSLDRHRAAIQSMVTSLRQDASVRQVHVELVFDYQKDTVTALSRRRLTTFAFEDMVGSGNVLGIPGGEARIVESRVLMLRDGKALDLPDTYSTFTIPWMETYDVRGEYEGIALTFDFYPVVVPSGGGGSGGSGNIAAMGPVFSLEVAESRADSVRLRLSCGGAVVESSTWIAAYRWATIEIAVSRYGVSLYVDGRLDEAELQDGFTVPRAAGNDLRLGGFSCRIDNLDLLALVSSSSLFLEGSHLIAWGMDPVREINGQTKFIYGPPSASGGPVTGDADGVPQHVEDPPWVEGVILPAPPPVVHVYFDSSGRLDPNRHPGAVHVYLVEGPVEDIRRMELTFHPLGAVTYEYLDLFPWERDGANR